MKKAIIVLAFLAACGGDGEWPESERQAFMENCERTSGGLTDYCECLLGKVEDRYPDPDDALDLSIRELTEMAGECR